MTKMLMLLNQENGVTSIEYSLIAVGIAVAIVIVVNSLGIEVLNLYQKLAGIPW